LIALSKGRSVVKNAGNTMAAKILLIDDNKSRFEEVAQKRGFDVKAFTAFEDAMKWLSTITLVTEDH
jgi:hypothetical protein